MYTVFIFGFVILLSILILWFFYIWVMKVVFISTCKNVWSCGSVGLDDIEVTLGDCALLGKKASFIYKTLYMGFMNHHCESYS